MDGTRSGTWDSDGQTAGKKRALARYPFYNHAWS